MYREPIFLKPAYQERIWGGTKLKKLFNFDILHDSTGEAWVISAHENGQSVVKNGPLQGKSLLEVWTDYPQLFGNNSSTENFPLLIKILDANDNLSVQVHPDDKYARDFAGEQFGKTECWYILDCEEDAEIIIGHHAKSAEEFKLKVENGDWDELLQRVKVKKGDFIYVPSGTIHAIGKGIVILETQQSSDITYRVYDYDRKDSAGNSRELHIEEAISVTTYPHETVLQEMIKETNEDLETIRLIEEKYFSVYHWELNGKVVTPLSRNFLLISVINGAGKIVIDENESLLKKGDNFILPATINEYSINGNLEMIVSHT